MKSLTRFALGTIAALELGMSVAVAQPFGMAPGMMHDMGPGMTHSMEHGAGAAGHGPMAGAVGMLTRQDAGFGGRHGPGARSGDESRQDQSHGDQSAGRHQDGNGIR